MVKRISFLLFLLLLVFTCAGSFFDAAASRRQKIRVALKSDNCVSCHEKLKGPLEVSARYMEWHLSPHRANGVGCEKCHGGDPATSDLKSAHSLMLPPRDPRSRLNSKNLPETCGTCHKAVVSSFVESTHYGKLKDGGLGPSCITCHGHMASKIARYPSEGAAFCSFCHNTVNGPQPRRPEIPDRARVTLESIGRANYMVVWITDLLGEAQKKNIVAREEREDLRLLQVTLSEAKIGWHSFDLEGPRIKAERAFEEGIRIRDRLQKKLGR